MDSLFFAFDDKMGKMDIYVCECKCVSVCTASQRETISNKK
jgi:hypothetical protein